MGVLVRLSRTSEVSQILSGAVDGWFSIQEPGLVLRPVALKLCLLYIHAGEFPAYPQALLLYKHSTDWASDEEFTELSSTL